MSDADGSGSPGGWSAPGGDQQDTTWVEHAPTAPVERDPDTVVLGDQPTTVDPLVPAPPAAPPPAAPAPAWGPPAAPPPAPAPAWGPPTGPPTGAAAWSGAALPGVAGWGAVPVAPKPGVIPLRPLGLGEILDGAISYIRRDPRTVLGISTVIALVVALLQFGATYLWGSSLLDSAFADPNAPVEPATEQIVGLYGATIIPAIVQWILQVVATGMLTVVMGQSVLGRRVTTAQAWERTKPRIWALFGVTILVGLIVAGVFIVGIGGAVLLGVAVAQAVDGAVGFLVGFALGVAAVVVGIWISVRLLLAPSALVLERSGVTMAMRRSVRLVKGAWWRTFGIYLLATILAQIISTVFSFPLGLLAGFLPLVLGEQWFSLAYAASTALAVLLSSIITLPFLAGVTSLLYIDRRIRREALDLELQRAAGAGV
ncbi:MAG: hypothetical protein AB7O74_14500 [Candidatus Nanopelagicales bacterium]